MPTFLATNEVDLRLGSSAVSAMYLGSTKVWPNYVPVSASRTPTTMSGLLIGPGTITRNIAVTASGGTGSYTYSSVWLSGGSGITITNATTATPGVTSTASPNLTRTGTLRTTVSDGVSSVTLDTPVTLTWET